MLSTHLAAHWHFWHLATRLGEAQVVLPLAFSMAVVRALGPATRTQALCWTALLGLAILLTTATKVAFIGWGIGSAALDFTGISGHTMFATAVYPPLLAMATGDASPRTHRLAIVAGCLVALLVGVSRWALATHSPSEIVAGWLAGGLVSAAVLARDTPVSRQLGSALMLAGAAWLAIIPGTPQVLDTHAMVTRLALALTGHDRPYTRSDLMRGRG